MSPHRLKRAALLGALLTMLLTGVAAAAALIEIDNLVLRADGSFSPQELPRNRFAPIEFEGRLDIASRDGGPPAALTQAVIDFDRDGRLDVKGLPSCRPEQVANAGTEQARRVCGGAIVGEGWVEALVSTDAGPVRGYAPATIFNGPAQNGHPTALVHARATVLTTETYAIVAPIERRPGPFRYRVTLDIPPLFGGRGAITHIEGHIGRRFRAAGRLHSYVAARCSDGLLDTHGIFTFADGMFVNGSVEKFCRAK